MIIKPFDSKINLTNSGNLSLFFIGTGNAFAKGNFQNNLLIIKGNSHILIDCGTLCPFALETKYNTKITEIENVLFTHQHADHIGGAEELVLIDKYIRKSPVNIIIPPKFKKKLWNESLRGGIQFSEKGKMRFKDYFNELPIKKIQKSPFEIYHTILKNIDLKLFRTRHICSKETSFKNSQLSYGIIIDEKILFTGDTQFNKNQLLFLLSKYKKIETIFHDCDVLGYSQKVHAAYEQLCTLPLNIRKKIYLCHYTVAVNNLNVTADGFAGLAKPGVYYLF